MLKILASRFIATSAAAAVMSAALLLPAPALAGGSTSMGHGVKCTWVLVSSVGGVNTYKQVCRRGV